jgi:hypothetical protein
MTKGIILLALLGALTTQAKTLLIEAEDFKKANSETPGFARVHTDIHASGQKIVLSLSKGGSLHYRFTIKKPGSYTGWVRYTRNTDRAVDGTVNDKPFQADTPAATEWGWARLFQTNLISGKNDLVLMSSPWRLDCLVISSDPKFVPTDETVFAESRKHTKQKLALMSRSVIPTVPDFINEMPDYELPHWFDGHRVQLHTRLSPNREKSEPELFYNGGKYFQEMGAKVVTRHIVSGAEGAWWPSKIGEINPMAKKRNPAKEVIDEAHEHDLKLIVYNRHIEDDWAAETHPEWRCIGPKGKPLMAPRGVNMCMNSPYADYILTRQLELVDLGADGFYYDSVHMPRVGCWCPYCREKFTALTGLEHPEAIDPEDPLWHKLKEFNNYSIARVFSEWRKALHARRPDLVMVVGSNMWPCTADKHMDQRAFRVIDSHKIEFNKGAGHRNGLILWPFPANFKPLELDVRLGYGFDVSRDAADGRPPHIWIPRILRESHMLAATAGAVAHGCIANLDVSEQNMPDPNFKTSFAMGDRVSPHLAGTKPLRHVAILHSEQARDRDGLVRSRVWRDTLYPIHGAYHVLLRDHIPCGFILDSQLAQRKFDGIDTLFVPNPSNLSDEQKSALADFKKSGGTIIENNPNWSWHTDTGWPKATEKFRKKLAGLSPPVQASGGNEKMHMQAYTSKDGKKLVTCLANDFSWIPTEKKNAEHVSGDTKESLKNKPPACSGVVLKLAYKPKRIFEANSGTELKWMADGIRIPDFENLAVIVAEY